MENLVTIVIVSLLISYLFYVVISNKWIPSKNFLISFLIGCSLVPIAILAQKGTLLNTFILNNENLKIFTWATIEEFLKITSILLFIKFNKNNKNNFIELLGIGIGFSLIETIMYSYGVGLGLFSGGLNISLMTLVLGYMGSLILHTSTIAIISLGIIYFKNKRKIVISTLSIIFVLIFHSLFNYFINIEDGEKFLTVFSITWLLFLIIYVLYLYFDFKNNNLFKIKKFIKIVAIFFGKYLLYIIFTATILVLLDRGVGELKNYTEKDIEQAKITQLDVVKIIDNWTENVSEGYQKYPDEVESIVEKLNIINNHYSRIISIAQEGGNLSTDDLSFLKTNGGEILEEVKTLNANLYKKISIDNLNLLITIINDTEEKFNSFFKKNGFRGNLENEYLKRIKISKDLSMDIKKIISEIELNENIKQNDIDVYTLEIENKMIEYKNQFDSLNKLISES